MTQSKRWDASSIVLDSDNSGKQTKLPCLLVSDFLAGEQLRDHFYTICSPEVPAAVDPKLPHILAFNPDTPEKIWRETAYPLLNAGCQVGVARVGGVSKECLQWWIENTSAKDVAFDILYNHISFSDWDDSLADNPLSLREALELAEVVLVNLRDEEKANIALDALRRRAGVSEYSWDKNYINKIRARLERTLKLNSPLLSKEELLRLDIKALLKESDPIAYEVMRADIQSRYRLNNKALERIISSISNLTKEAEAKPIGLDELFDLRSDSIDYLVPGMLPAGEAVLLAAGPKAGKSLLAYDLAFAVATGESNFLGENCKQGKVLIIQCDESIGTAKGRLQKRGFRREDGSNVRFMHKFNINQIEVLEKELETFRPTLVIIDCLRRINAGNRISENDSAIADDIYKLKEVCTQYNSALLLIHHNNKNSDAVGIEKVRGSTAIAGAVWGVWDLSQIPKPDPKDKRKLIIDPQDPTRILSIAARDVEGQRLEIELDPENNHWINKGQEGADEQKIKEQKSQGARVVELLKSVAPQGLEGSEIKEHLGIGTGIYSVLNRLLNQKVIGSRPSEKNRRCTVYFYTTGTPQQPDNPPPPTLTDSNVIKDAKTIDIHCFQPLITIDHTLITLDHTPLCDEHQKQASNPEPKGDTTPLITSTQLGGGECVKSPDLVTVQESVITPLSPIKNASESAEIEVDEQEPEQAQLNSTYEVELSTEATNPETTPLEQLIIRLENVTTKEGFETVTAGQSLETIQNGIDLQNTAPHRQLLKGFFNEVHHAK